MLRIIKPGGIVAAREEDLDTEVMWPPLLGILKFHHECVPSVEQDPSEMLTYMSSLEVKLITGRGGCATSGRQLLSWALRLIASVL
jgi:hypothetical protein